MNLRSPDFVPLYCNERYPRTPGHTYALHYRRQNIRRKYLTTLLRLWRTHLRLKHKVVVCRSPGTAQRKDQQNKYTDQGVEMSLAAVFSTDVTRFGSSVATVRRFHWWCYGVGCFFRYPGRAVAPAGAVIFRYRSFGSVGSGGGMSRFQMHIWNKRLCVKLFLFDWRRG